MFLVTCTVGKLHYMTSRKLKLQIHFFLSHTVLNYEWILFYRRVTFNFVKTFFSSRLILRNPSTVHRDAFCKFPFRWIYYCHSKGQLISKCPFSFIVWTKLSMLFLNFCPEIFCTFLGASWKLFGAYCRLPCL